MMKCNIINKLAGIALLLLPVLFLSSCEDEFTPQVNKNCIRIVANNLLFGPQGGTGTVEFESSEAVQAYSEQPWCDVSVSGNIVTVVATGHIELENRYSSIILHSGNDSVRVVAQQNGVIINADIKDKYLLDDEARTINFNVESNGQVTINSSVEWIRCTVDGNSASVEILKNDSGHVRAGSFTYACGKASHTVEVSQASVKDLYGFYRLMGYNNNKQLVYLPAIITAGNNENQIKVACSGEEYSWSFTGEFNPQTHTLTFDNSQYVGPLEISGNSFYVYLCMLSQASGGFTWDSSMKTTASIGYDLQKHCTIIKNLPYKSSESSGVTTYDSWVFAAFMKQDAAGKPSGSPSAYPAILYEPYFQRY